MIPICITSKECNTSYRDISPTVYIPANGYNHGCTFCMILWRVVWYTPLKWRVLVRMIGFLALGYTLTLNHTQRYRLFTPFRDHRWTRTRILSLHYSSRSNGSQHRNCHGLTFQMLHINLLFTEALFTTHAENYCNLPPRTTCKRASVSPINPWSDKRETLIPTMLLLLRHCWNAWSHCWYGHVTSPHSCVIQVFIAVAWQQVRQGDARRGATRHGTAEVGSARRKHPFVYCCVIAGTCFDVTDFTWHKSAKILFSRVRLNLPGMELPTEALRNPRHIKSH
jgi:hypothetical protein